MTNQWGASGQHFPGPTSGPQHHPGAPPPYGGQQPQQPSGGSNWGPGAGHHWGPAGMGSGTHGPHDPSRPITTGRDARIPFQAPEPPKQSKAPFIMIGGVIVLALLALTIGGIATWRADQAQQNATATPPPTQTGSPLPSNVRPFTTETCDDGLFEVLDHERVGSELYIQVRISCEEGRYRADPAAVAIFDQFSEAYRNNPPLDRPALEPHSVSAGSPAEGWVRFHDVPSGEVTVLLLGYRRTTTAVPLQT